VLLKALGDFADFKTDKTLSKVENFLKVCHKNATEMFFGYRIIYVIVSHFNLISFCLLNKLTVFYIFVACVFVGNMQQNCGKK